jgi:hypothetical protein
VDANKKNNYEEESLIGAVKRRQEFGMKVLHNASVAIQVFFRRILVNARIRARQKKSKKKNKKNKKNKK